MVDVLLVRRADAGRRGYIYDIYLGPEVLASGVSPEYKTCRGLLARGYNGKVRFWRAGRRSHDFEMDISKCAGRTLSEGQHGFSLGRWAPFEGVSGVG